MHIQQILIITGHVFWKAKSFFGPKFPVGCQKESVTGMILEHPNFKDPRHKPCSIFYCPAVQIQVVTPIPGFLVWSAWNT